MFVFIRAVPSRILEVRWLPDLLNLYLYCCNNGTTIQIKLFRQPSYFQNAGWGTPGFHGVIGRQYIWSKFRPAKIKVTQIDQNMTFVHSNIDVDIFLRYLNLCYQNNNILRVNIVKYLTQYLILYIKLTQRNQHTPNLNCSEYFCWTKFLCPHPAPSLFCRQILKNCVKCDFTSLSPSLFRSRLNGQSQLTASGTDRREFGGMGIAWRIMSCRNSPMIRILLELLRGQRSSARNEKWGWICEWEWERERKCVYAHYGWVRCFALIWRALARLLYHSPRASTLLSVCFYFAQVPEELEWEEPSLVSDAQHPLCLFLPHFDSNLCAE
jgi:hypothetical protein